MKNGVNDTTDIPEVDIEIRRLENDFLVFDPAAVELGYGVVGGDGGGVGVPGVVECWGEFDAEGH